MLEECIDGAEWEQSEDTLYPVYEAGGLGIGHVIQATGLHLQSVASHFVGDGRDGKQTIPAKFSEWYRLPDWIRWSHI